MDRIKNQTLYEAFAVIISLFAFSFRTIVQKTSALMAFSDIGLLYGVFTSMTDTKKGQFYFKLVFWMFAITSIINEGIIKNAGGDNWINFELDLLVKIFTGALIYEYIGNKNKLKEIK